MLKQSGEWRPPGRYRVGAKEENALRTDATPTTGGRRQNLALLRFNGNGTYDNLGFTVNDSGVVTTGVATKALPWTFEREFGHNERRRFRQHESASKCDFSCYQPKNALQR